MNGSQLKWTFLWKCNNEGRTKNDSVVPRAMCSVQPQHADYAACLQCIALLDTVAIELLTGRNFTVPGTEEASTNVSS